MREVQEKKAENITADVQDGPKMGPDTPPEAVREGTAPKPADSPNVSHRSKWFGRGIYGSKDVPIRLLDGVIGIFIAAAVILVIFATINGGFQITFDTDGGSPVESQKLRHGSLVAEPEAPVKAGYTFEGWYRVEEPEVRWDFATDKVGGDLKLSALWAPAEILVKFDLDGGTVDGSDTPAPMTVTYLEPYGKLPAPQKEGAEFAGWMYSGNVIEEDTTVTMTGEHVLTAQWR